MRIETFAGSEQGPRDEQEDAFAVREHCLVVADGMGGHEGGARAAQIAAESLADELEDDSDITAAISWACRQIREEGAGGTTLVLAQLQAASGGIVANIAWVGDSRAYLVRNGHATCLTEDHVDADGGLTHWLPDEPRCEMHTEHLLSGDTLVLCSDGVWSVAEDVLARVGDVHDPAEWLLEYADEAGANDNCTVVGCRVI